MSSLLGMHLEVTVPMAIQDLTARGGPSESDFEAARKFAGDLGGKGDQILYRGPETAALVAALARHMAVLAWVPGGIEFCGVRWCARHRPMGHQGHCPECSSKGVTP